MAGSSIIGALRVVLGADTANFETGLKKSESNLKSFAKNVATIASGIALERVIEKTFSAISASIKKAVIDADELGKMSQKIGVPVEQLSALRYAADLSGVSLEQLSVGLGKLAKNMIDAAAKPTGEAAKAFEALGISSKFLTDNLNNPNAVLEEIADRFSGLKDGAGKTAVAMAIFGKSGKDLIPLLNSGKDGLQQLTEEAQKLGIIIDTKTAKSAENFNDNLTRLGYAKDALVLKITAKLLPGLERLSQSFIDIARNGDLITTVGDAISREFENIGKDIDRSRIGWERAGLEWRAFLNTMKQIPLTEAAFQAWREYHAILEETKRLQDNVKNGIDTFAVRFDAAAGSIKPLKQALKDVNYAALGSESAISKYIKSVEQANATQQIEIATSKMATDAAEAYRIVQVGKNKALEDGAPASQAEIDRLKQLGAAAGGFALHLKGIQLVKENLAPEEAYRLQMEETTAAMIAAGATSGQLALAQEKVKEKFGESAEAIGLAIANISGSMSNLLGAVAKDNKALGLASKAFGIAQVIINTQIAITKALATLGPIGGPIAAAVMAAQGAASVATIAAQGFAHGGSFRIGGSGGMDSQMVQFMGTPGEMVDVRTPGELASSGGGSTEIILRARRLTDFLTMDDLRDLVDGLNSANRDGYKLKVAK